MKQLRNRETTRLSVPVLTSQPYFPQSPALGGCILNRKWNFLRLKHEEEELMKFMQHQDFIKQKQILSYIL